MAEPKVYHAKGKDDWGTTQGLYDALHTEFGFDLDVCATDQNAKCPIYLTEQMDALSIQWWGRCFMNPPHSRTEAFIAYMVQMLLEGHIDLGVAVVAARTDTLIHHMATCFAGEVRYLKGRLSYEVFPTEKQRGMCATLQGIHIGLDAWPMLVKEIGLPQTAIKRLILDPTYSGPDLSQAAPFPSLVYIFDRRPHQETVYWDWKKQQRTVYVFGGPQPGKKKVVLGPFHAMAKKPTAYGAPTTMATKIAFDKLAKLSQAAKHEMALEKAKQDALTAAKGAGKGMVAMAQHVAQQPTLFFLGPTGLHAVLEGEDAGAMPTPHPTPAALPMVFGYDTPEDKADAIAYALKTVLAAKPGTLKAQMISDFQQMEQYLVGPDGEPLNLDQDETTDSDKE